MLLCLHLRVRARRDARSAAPSTNGDKLVPETGRMFAKFQPRSVVGRRNDEEGADLSRLSAPT